MSIAALEAALQPHLGSRLRRDAPLGARTTYRVGGPAALLVEAAGRDDLLAVRDALVALAGAVAVVVVGNGSNLLVADAGFPGLVIVLGEELARVEIDGTTVEAGGAALLPVIARRSASVGLHGFEWAVGVPGSMGGAVRMNAGGHGSDVAASLRGVHVIDLLGGHDGWVLADALDLGYRSSAIAASTVVLGAELSLAHGERAQAEEAIVDVVRWRRTNQPGGQNAGSVFTNPEGDSAGRLIDAAGARGLRVGSAQVSTKHANFIIADASGRADDVLAVMTAVHDRVAARFGVELVAETRLCGFTPAAVATVVPRSETRPEVEG
ncbi:MAG: UDP-N-acetylmuramate dehydrogenase [Acidimicrobiales bacterium]